MIKYPIKRKQPELIKQYGKLGMTLEEDVNVTNQYYLLHNIAVIHKKPTPVQVVSVSYPSRNKAKITEAYYKTPSTTDYNGIFNGHYLDFDCKETTSMTSLPLSNIHLHQQQHLKKVHEQKGIAFLLVHFKKHKQYFFMPYEVLAPYFDKTMNRLSIPYQSFIDRGIEISLNYEPRLDYLKAVKTYLDRKGLNEPFLDYKDNH
jgi:recombination protein U